MGGGSGNFYPLPQILNRSISLIQYNVVHEARTQETCWVYENSAFLPVIIIRPAKMMTNFTEFKPLAVRGGPNRLSMLSRPPTTSWPEDDVSMHLRHLSSHSHWGSWGFFSDEFCQGGWGNESSPADPGVFANNPTNKMWHKLVQCSWC